MTAGGVVVWFTGRPSSGKSTLARQVRKSLQESGACVCLLDGDEVRARVFPEQGYTDQERAAFYRRLGALAALLADQGGTVLVAATAALRSYRDAARSLAPAFVEVFLDVSAAECERRDAKGLYLRARSGTLGDLPGVGAPYEAPLAPELVVGAEGVAEAAARVAETIERVRAAPGR